MNKVMSWAKSNLVIVISIALALIAIPVLFYFGSSWNKSLQEQIRQDVSRSMSQLQGLQVTHEIPAMLPGQEAWFSTTPPSAAKTDRVAEILEELRAASERGREAILDRNRRGKEPLIGGPTREEQLFPEPSNPQTAVRLPTEFVRRWPVALRELLSVAQAGDAPSQADVAARLESRRERLRNQLLTGRVVQELSGEEQAEIRETLGRERLEMYQQHASRLAFYAVPESFGAYAEVVAAAAATTPVSVEQAFEWQWRLWIYQDIVDAIAIVNRDATRPFVALYESPVKRLVSVRVDTHGDSGSGGGRGGSRDLFGGDVGIDTGGSSAGYSVAHTGRLAWPNDPSNQLYDIRYVTLELVVDSNRLPQIIEAISSVNFMTVIGLDLRPFNPAADLANGFVYASAGDATAVATIRLETIWLREWMKQYMPSSVRERLGVVEESSAEGAADGDVDGEFN